MAETFIELIDKHAVLEPQNPSYEESKETSTAIAA
jgi:hypothetical protein